jgi:hypothetical protein
LDHVLIAESLRGSVRRHPVRWGVVAVTVAALGAFALYWFAPWNLVIDRRVDEAIPTARDVPRRCRDDGRANGLVGG